MGEKETEPFQFTCNGFLKVDFQGSRVTSDAGLILVRELDERLGLETVIAEHLSDCRQGLNTQFRLTARVRCMASKKVAPTTGTSSRSATTRCFSSTATACLAATLRPGNVHSADEWDELLVPEIERQQAEGKRVAFRADAAFAKPEIYNALEKRDVDYAIRMPANDSLEWEIADLLFRPPGRPSHKPLVRYKTFRYQAESWTEPRRIVTKVEHHQVSCSPASASS